MAEHNKQADILFQQHRLAKRFGSENDPDRPPPKKPGDAWLVGGTVLGLVFGAGLGGVLAYLLRVLVLVPAGMLFGGFVGLLGGIVAKRHVSRRKPRKSWPPETGGRCRPAEHLASPLSNQVAQCTL